MSASVWDEPTEVRLPALREKVTADCCVVGLGGAGLAAIAELASRGHRVVGLEAGAIGGGAAGRNGGFLLAGMADSFHENVAQFGGEIAASLYRQTLEEIQRTAEDPPAEVRLTGSLRIAGSSDEVRDCEEQLRALLAHGFAAERYAGPEGTGLLIPTDGVYHPQRCLRGTIAKLPAQRVRLFGDSPVTAISPGRVATATGEVSCDRVIVAVDGGLERVLPELAGRVRTARLQMLATAPTRDVSFPRPVYLRYGYEYWQQLPGGELALGGFRDRGGEAEWTTAATPGGIVQNLLEDFLRVRLRSKAPVVERWAACVAYTADRLPILEEVRPGVFAAGAYSGTGNVTSRLGGRAAAQLASGARSAWAEAVATARRQAGAGKAGKTA